MLTLLVPTKNRPDFLIRLLSYYYIHNFKHTILIGDSSSKELFDKANKQVQKFKKKIKILHFHHPNHSNYSVTQLLIKKVKSPYVSWLPDDDFFVISSLEKMISFLENNDDYIGAWGKTILFNLDKQGPFGSIKYLEENNHPTNFPIKSNSAELRLLEYVKFYTSLFLGVCRTENLKKAIRNAIKLNNTIMNEQSSRTAMAFGEIITSYSLAAQGKFTSIDCLYWVRQHHNQRYIMGDFIDLITSPNWSECYQILKNQIIEDFMQNDKINKIKASSIFNKIYKVFLFRTVNSLSPNLKKKKILYKIIKKFSSLRLRYSIYYNDFIPIKEIVNKENN